MKRIIVLIGLILSVLIVIYGQESFQEIIVQGNTLTRKFEWLLTNAETGRTYVVVLDRDETLLEGHILDYYGREIKLILRGRGAMRRISLAKPVSDSLFSVRSGVTLVLENLVTLQGATNSSEHFGGLVRVGVGGKLVMNINTGIGENTSWRGVSVDGGIFIMNGGTIFSNGNRDSRGGDGGGVLIMNGGDFIMNGGTISGNFMGSGGGVCLLSGSTFTMNEGSISGNSANGVELVGGTFTMNGGSISGNSGTGGINISENGIFNMFGGYVSGNITTSHYYGEISGGVTVYSGTFNIKSPATKSSISGNITHLSGVFPQVNISNNGTFIVNGLQELGY